MAVSPKQLKPVLKYRNRSTFWLVLTLILLVTANLLVWWKVIGLPVSSAKDAIFVPTVDRLTKPGNRSGQAYKVAVPILMYHYIRDYNVPSDQLGISLSVSPAVLRQQLQLIKKEGYQTISLTDFVAGKVKPKSIILTFDDGYDDHYTNAFPILKEEGMTGTFFIVKNFVNTPRYVTSSQLAEMKAAGMELGDHTVSHRNLAALTYDQAYKEIIGGNTANLAPVFAYPSGKYSDQTLTILKNIHEKVAVTTTLGLATDTTDPLQLPRIRVKEKTDILKVIEEQQYLLDHPGTTPSKNSASSLN